MKPKSKIYFVLGILATLGTMTLVYSKVQDTDKTPSELLKDSKKFIKLTVKKGDSLIDQTLKSVEKETNKILKEASNIV